ncbi:MAG: restriction endonuclease subunit S [Candidatus Electrothrix sp. AR3]|nr:restriction endonuclease subunit S [Candidatus Electrothrix sp. AR3]
MKIAAVGDISEQVRGVSYAKSDASDVPLNGYSPILRANNIGEQGLILEKFVFVPNTKISPKQKILSNDIIVAASSGSISVVGKTAQVREKFEGSFGAFCKVLRPDSSVCPHYFGHYFRTLSYRQEVSRLAVGANINNLKNEHLNNLKIPLPPLAEQKRIAAILDAADALRAKRRESLVQLDALLQSTFLDMFGDPVTNPMGWKMVRLSDVVKRLDGGKNIAKSETETDYRVLKVSAVTYGEYRPQESKYLPAEFNVPESYLVRKGDLLISRANTVELIGATAYVWETPERIMLPDKIWKFIWKENAEIEPLFMYHLSQHPRFRQILGSRASGTSGSMKNIAKPKLLSMLIPHPPLELQKKFAAIVESVERQKAKQQAHLAELDTLFAALQQKAFNGKL